MIDIYPVGVLHDLLFAWRTARRGQWRIAARVMRGMLRTLAYRVRRREWRALKNVFNGYLAEPTPWPEGMRRCGSGWTKARALRSARRHGYDGQ